MNPKKHLEYYSRVYPSAWKQVDQMRQDRGKQLPFWPEWCFLPLASAYAIVSAEAESQGIDITSEEGMPLANDIGIIGALAAWRVTQGVYRFDPDVFAAVIETPITGDLPHDVLFNLPEWCVYVETPVLTWLGKPLTGFFAYLEYDLTNSRKELRFVMDTMVEEGKPWLISQVLHLGPWPLAESIARALQEAGAQTEMVLGQKYTLAGQESEVANIIKDDYTPLLSLLLYLCSVNGEIGDGDRRPVRPRSTKTKKGLRLFPPNKPTTWDVGIRMGAALRKAREMSGAAETKNTEGKQRSAPRAHVRRAHWHGYWTGPRDGDQKFTLKWISPVLVGSGEIPVTVRPVK